MVYTTYHNSYGRRDPMPECIEIPWEIDEHPVQRVVKGSGFKRVDCPCCEGAGEHQFGAGEDADGVMCQPCGGWGQLERIGDRPPIIRKHPVSEDLRLTSLELDSPIAAEIWIEATNSARYHRAGAYTAAEERREKVSELLEPHDRDVLDPMAHMMLGEPKDEYRRGEGILFLMATKVINHAAQRIIGKRQADKALDYSLALDKIKRRQEEPDGKTTDTSAGETGQAG